jgi:hypothetical protein
MMGKFSALISATILFFLVAAVGVTSAQNTLDSDLQKTFKPASLASDSTGLVVTEAGTVLAVKKGGVRAYPPSDQTVLPNKYQDGTMHTAAAKTVGGGLRNLPGFGSRIPGQSVDKGDNSRLLAVGTKVYATKISVDAPHDKVSINIVECDSCNGVQQPSSFKGQIDFQFPKGYLNGADAGQLSDIIAQVLDPSSGDANAQGGDQQAQAQGGGQQQAAAPAGADPPKQPQSIEKGMTEDQVVAAFGQPDKVVNLGAKKLLVYKDMKVTLIGGKVADVQ